MKKKRYIQSCEIGGSIYGKRKGKRNTGHSQKSVSSKDLAETYNKFFKNQVAALYKAIKNS